MLRQSPFSFARREHRFDREQATWLVASFCTLHRVAFDPELFAQRYPAPITEESLEQAAGDLGLVFESRQCSLRVALGWHLPLAISVRVPIAREVDWALVLNASDSRAAILERESAAPVSLSMQELAARYKGCALTMVPQPGEAVDPDSLQFRSARFGLSWFVPELLKHRRIWRDVLIASFVLQLMALAVPLFTQVIIDKVVVRRATSTLLALGTGMAVFLVSTGVLSWVRQHLVLHTGRRIDAVLGAHVFDHLLRLPPVYFQARSTGVVVARLHAIEAIREFVASAAVTLLLDVPFLLLFIAIMFCYSVSLTLIVLAVLAVIMGASVAVAPVFQRLLSEQFQRDAASQAFLTEYVSAMDTVKSLQLEPQLNQRYRNLLADLLKSSLATRRLANTYNTWSSSLEQLMTALVLVVGAWLVMTTTALTIGMLVAFQMFSARISQPLLRMVGLWQQWQQTRLSVARLGDIMNAPAESYSLTPRRIGAAGPSAIEIQGLAFRYSEQMPYLFENLDLVARPGQLVALMGPSGVGKSTLVRLLQGFCVPSRGRIRVNGVDHSHLSANELRSNFGVVPQDTVLFSGSILDNLMLANPLASLDQVVAACRMAEIHGVIDGLPQGYQTQIGERGAGLSGGQRQRVSIARALLKGPRALIFDEATSSVDSATAEQLGRTISALKGRVTILFIAHRLPRSLLCDQVVCLPSRAVAQ